MDHLHRRARLCSPVRICGPRSAAIADRVSLTKQTQDIRASLRQLDLAGIAFADLAHATSVRASVENRHQTLLIDTVYFPLPYYWNILLPSPQTVPHGPHLSRPTFDKSREEEIVVSRQ